MLIAVGVFRGEIRARRSAGILGMITGVQVDVRQGDAHRWRNFGVDSEHRPWMVILSQNVPVPFNIDSLSGLGPA